jgi:hypothetical protein
MQTKRVFWLAAERASFHAGTWWFAPAGGVSAALLAHLLGVQVTFAPFFPENSLLRAAFDAGALVVLAYIVLFSGWFLWFMLRRWAMAYLNIYLVVSAIGAVIMLGGLAGYFFSPPRSPIEWDFQQTGYALRLEWVLQRVGEVPIFYVSGFVFPGKNGPEPLYQIRASVTIDRDKREIPLYVVAGGQWARFPEIVSIPADVRVEIGCQMRDDGLHCEEFPKRISPEQFLADLGGFTFEFAHDGEPPQKWHFSSAELRRQFEKQKLEAEDQIRKNPLLQPSVTRRNPS